MSATYQPGVYLRQAELEALLSAWAGAHPGLVALESIGQTKFGKDLWLLTITDEATGVHSEKPAFWCDGNTHAGEVTGAQACLHLVHTLLSAWDDGEARTRSLLGACTVYVLPRISADGAEMYLTTPHSCRSSPMMWPEPQPSPGLQPKDIDGNGELLLMRVPHSAGAFKASKVEPRLMLPREPDDDGADGEVFYRLLNEGEYEGYDGFEQPLGTRWGLDANRHFPHGFRPEGQQPGAGPHPMFLPEIDAVVKAITARNNICTIQSYHTYSAVVLRPPINGSDSDMSQADLTSFKALDLRAEAATGYPAVSIAGGFKYDPNVDIAGGSNDWMYEDRGIFAYVTEIWHLFKASGVFGSDRMRPHKEVDHISYLKKKKEQDLVCALRWCDANLPEGSYYQEWTPFDHPQLGRIEIGGWRWKYTWQNPPPSLLEAELAKQTEFALTLARCLPRVRLVSAAATALGGGFSRVRVHARNDGFLPTYCSAAALRSAAVRREAKATLSLGEGLTLVSGAARPVLRHLEGRSRHAFDSPHPFGGNEDNAFEAELQWVVSGTGTLAVELDFQRGGVLTAQLEVDGAREAVASL